MTELETIRSLATEADQLLAAHGQFHNMHGHRHAIHHSLQAAEAGRSVLWDSVGVLIANMRWAAANGAWPKRTDNVKPIIFEFE